MSLLVDAVRNNAAWCALVSGSGSTEGAVRGVWCTAGDPWPLFPDAVTLRPAVLASDVSELLADRPRCSVKDSFADLDLAPHDFRPLFEARWIGRRQPDAGGAGSWTVVCDERGLQAWCAAADLPRALPTHLLDDRSVTILAASRRGRLVGGAVLNRSWDVVGLSNVFAVDGNPTPIWAGVAAAAEHFAPRLPIVGYEHGADLDAALSAGFADLGPLRVWIRPPSG